MTHPLIPPPELVQQWINEDPGIFTDTGFAARAAQWGWDQREPEIQAAADAELDSSSNWLVLNGYGEAASRLRAARRPKPPSFKEQALAILASVAVCELHGDAAPDNRLSTKDIDTIRRALEALSDD